MSDNGIPAIGAQQSVAAPSKGKKVAKVIAGTALLAGIAATALAAKNGDVFSKVKGAWGSAEGGNFLEKLKQVVTKDNITKGVKALGDGFKAIPGQAAKVFSTAKEKVTGWVDDVKAKFSKNSDELEEYLDYTVQ